MVCLDANVMLEIVEKRAGWQACRNYLADLTDDLAITMLTVHLMMYFAEKDRLDWRAVKAFLERYHWLPLMPTDANWAFVRFDGKDFEDALQVGCALRAGCTRFATLDQTLAKKYKAALPIDLIK